MGAPNPNWVRWVMASIFKYFDDAKGPYFLHIEGTERATKDLDKWAELRVNGPHIFERSKKDWELSCEINVLVSAQANSPNCYDYPTLSGWFAALFASTIHIYKFGSEVGDDQSYVGCLQIQSNGNEKIQVSHFGVIEPGSNLQQGSVDAHYNMYLSE